MTSDHGQEKVYKEGAMNCTLLFIVIFIIQTYYSNEYLH